jgi:hypothetical protein
MLPALAALALAALCAPALAATDLDERTDAALDGRVEVSNTSGAVLVRGWDRPEVHVTGRLGEGTDELRFERRGDRVVVEVRLPRRGGRDVEPTNLEVSVPRASTVEIDTVDAEITVLALEGRLRAHSVSGDLQVETAGRELELESVSGDVRLEGAGQDARLRLSSVSGDVRAEGVSGEVEAESVSGDLVLALGTVRRLEVNSTSGRLELRTALEPDARLDLESVSGDVEVTVDGATDGHYELRSFAGDIEACFGPEPERQRYGPGRRLDFTQGDGGPLVRIQTMSGEIEVCD